MKSALSLLFLISSLIVQAQITRLDTTSAKGRISYTNYKTQTLYSYTLGIKAFGLEEFPKILNEVHPEEFRQTYVNGLIFKFNDNQISYRLSGAAYKKDVRFDNECADCEEAAGNLSDIQLKVGFEKNFIYGFVQPYFGSDFGFRRNIFKGAVTATDPAFSSYDVKSQKNGLSIAPVLGIKFNLIEHFTLAAESSFSLLYSYEKQNRTTSGTAKISTFQDYKKWEFLFMPVNMLGLQYNFGLNY